MIDPKALRDHPDRLRAAQLKRGLSVDVVDDALVADERRRSSIVEFERLRGEQKTLGRLIPKAQGEERQSLLERTKALSAEVKKAEAAQGEADAAYRACLLSIPNPAAEEAPAGGEDDYVVLEHVGEPRAFDFEPRDHVELGRMLGAIDIDRGAKVSGARFYYLTGVGADLELALVTMAMDQARGAGFTTMIPPT
ncbi:MAG: serine--tRNA ligase, partial [Nocardioidaceae bacterium]